MVAMRWLLVASVLTTACSADEPVATAEDGATETATDATSETVGEAAADTDVSTDTRPLDTGPPPADIATWTDVAGACPTGSKRVELSTAAQIMDASRGEGAYAADPADTCYLVKNGTYAEGSSLLFFVKKGGTTTSARRFVGESRTGVVIHGRAGVGAGSDHVVFENLTFDLTGFVKSGSFNTFDIGADDVTLTRVTFTGDCATGFRGGHIEVTSGTKIRIDSCIVEKFGHCGPTGHEDHGIYLANGSDIVVRNSIIRGNASRGILFNTQQGTYGKLKGVLVEYNRIHDNGHADYEDGIAVNMEGTGNVDDVTIRRNLIYGNYFSGLRFVGNVTTGFDVQRNTFYGNGQRSSHAGRSNLNLDAPKSGGKTLATKNVFAASKAMLNDCYDATPRGFSLSDNVVFSSANTTGDASCVSKVVTADPGFTSPTTFDFHTGAAVAGYGAY